MKKALSAFIALLALLFLFEIPSHAADFDTSCDGSTCTPSSFTNFYDPSFKWYPLATKTTTIQIANTSGISQPIGIQAFDISSTGAEDSADVIMFEIRKISTNALLYSDTLKSFYIGGEVFLGNIPQSSSETYSFKATMQDVGNEYQDTSTTFDMDIGFLQVTPTPTPTLTPTPGGISSSSSSSGGGGGGDGGSSSSSSSTSSSDTPSILGAATSFFNQFAGSVLGEDIEIASESAIKKDILDKEQEEVLGDDTRACVNVWWWWIVILVFLAVELLFISIKEHLHPLLKIIAYLGTGSVAATMLYLILCNPFWWILGVVLVSLFTYVYARSD
jgi:hypothetical protein